MLTLIPKPNQITSVTPNLTKTLTLILSQNLIQQAEDKTRLFMENSCCVMSYDAPKPPNKVDVISGVFFYV